MCNHIDIQGYLDVMHNFYDIVIQYLDADEYYDCFYDEICNFFENNGILSNHNKLKEILHLISAISNNYHRSVNFWEKIDKILTNIQTEISSHFSNYEIFNIFKENKRVLLLFFKKKLIIPDNNIIKIILNDRFKNMHYAHYFYPEFKSFYDEDLIDEIKKSISDDLNSDLFETKRRIGENDNYLCTLIRNDSVVEFISYVNRRNLNLNQTEIQISIYETNPYLINKTPTIIEYSAFFGSIQIFRYLLYNNVELPTTLWKYSIHSNNPELIHILEENSVHIKYNYQLIKESIKCHHINLANYFKDQININYQYENSWIVKYRSLPFFPSKFDDSNYSFFYKLCKYDYPSLIESVLQNNKEFKATPKKSNCKSAFGISVKKGNNEIVKFLLEKTEIDINLSFLNKIFCMKKNHYVWSKLTKYYGSPIFHAIYLDNTELKNHLLSQSNINLNGKYYIQINLEDDKYDKIKIDTNILLIAIEKDDMEFIRYLFTRNDVDFDCTYKIKKYYKNKIIKSSENPVFNFAIMKGNLEIVQFLYSREEIDLNCVTKINGEELTSLGLAIEENKEQIVEFLLSKKEILDSLSNEYDNLLLKAVDNNYYIIVNLLLKAKEIKINEITRISTLYHTIAKDSKQLMQIILTKEDIKDTFLNIFGDLLTMAIDKNYNNIVKYILSQDYIQLQKISYLKTAIYRNREIIELLLEREDINKILLSTSNKDNIDILFEAIDANNLKIFQYLVLEKKININKRIPKYMGKVTVLYYAIQKRKDEFVQFLLTRDDINVNKPIKSKYEIKNPLYIAIENKNQKIVQLLLSNKNIDINYISKIKKHEFGCYYNDDLNMYFPSEYISVDEYTSLHAALLSQQLEIVTHLLKRNDLKINIKRKSFRASYCYLHRKFEYEEKFEEVSPLHIAIKEKLYNIIELLLLKKELEINDKCISKSMKYRIKDIHKYFKIKNLEESSEKTALHIAILDNDQKLLQLLLKRPEIDLNAKFVNNIKYSYLFRQEYEIYELLIFKYNIESKKYTQKLFNYCDQFSINGYNDNKIKCLEKFINYLKSNDKFHISHSYKYDEYDEYDEYDRYDINSYEENAYYRSFNYPKYRSFLKFDQKVMKRIDDEICSKSNSDIYYNEIIHIDNELNEIKSPLFIAVEARNPKIVKLLLNREEVNVNFKSNIQTLKKLILKKKYQTDLTKEEYCKNEQKTALFLSFEKEDFQIIKLLLPIQSIDVNEVSSETLLCNYENHPFSAKKLIELINFKSNLLNASKKVNQKTVLFLSVEKQSVELITLLLSKLDINIYIENSNELIKSFEFFNLNERRKDIVSIFDKVEGYFNNEMDNRILIFFFFI